MNIGLLLHLGVLQQDHTGTERTLLFCRYWFWFVELGMVTNSPVFPWMELLHSQIVHLCNQYILRDYLTSCFGTTLHILLRMHYLCWLQNENSDFQVSEMISLGAPPWHNSWEASIECGVAAANTLNAGKLLLVAWFSVFPTAAKLETQSVMNYRVQKLNAKK